MTAISHHIPDSILAAYAAGSLPHGFALVVAAHVSMCGDCRAQLGAHEALGGAVLDSAGGADVSDDLKLRVLDMLDAPEPPVPPRLQRSGIFPAPVMEALHGLPPKWKTLGMGVRQSILHRDAESSVRLLYIPPGMAVPDHGHSGLEMTMVLQGAFRDETGRFGIGDVECADDDLEHTPVAEDGDPCICLAATDGALRFNAFVPRLLQPLFRI
jgi:putative transcriptional regulator